MPRSALGEPDRGQPAPPQSSRTRSAHRPRTGCRSERSDTSPAAAATPCAGRAGSEKPATARPPYPSHGSRRGPARARSPVPSRSTRTPAASRAAAAAPTAPTTPVRLLGQRPDHHLIGFVGGRPARSRDMAQPTRHPMAFHGRTHRTCRRSIRRADPCRVIGRPRAGHGRRRRAAPRAPRTSPSRQTPLTASCGCVRKAPPKNPTLRSGR